MAEQEVVLKIVGLDKSFGITHANCNIDLELKKGEIRGLAGENGSGKSTLLSQVAGLVPIDKGELFVKGEPYMPKSPIEAQKRKIAMARYAEKAAIELEKEGKSVEVIDPRTIVPLDMDTIVKSVNKTGKLLIVDEGHENFGISGEIAWRTQKDAFYSLEAPIMGGANDFILGCDSKVVRANLSAMIHQAYAAKIKVLLGIQIDCDTPRVRDDWRAIADFEKVSEKTREMAQWLPEFCAVFQIPYINLYERFREQIAGAEQDYYIDGIHPNEKGHRLMADILREDGAVGGYFQ